MVTYHQAVSIARATTTLSLRELLAVLFVVIHVCFVVVALTFVSFGHALARASEAHC